MSLLATLLLVSTVMLLVLDYAWRVTSISLRKALIIVLPLWLLLLAVIWLWMV